MGLLQNDDKTLHSLYRPVTNLLSNIHLCLFYSTCTKVHSYSYLPNSGNSLLHINIMVNIRYILNPSSNRSPYIFTLGQKVKHRVYKVHAILNEAILCGDSASYFILR